MADVLKRLAGPVALTTSAVTRYTVPSLATAVVRDIHVCNETATEATFTLSVGTDGAGKRLYKDLTVPANGAVERTGSVVLRENEVLQALASVGAALTLTISGVESS